MNIEKTIARFVKNYTSDAYKKFKKETRSCINFGLLIEVAEKGTTFLSHDELKHLNLCQYCQVRLTKLQTKVIAVFPKRAMLACAGTPKHLGNLPEELLSNSCLPSSTKIISEKRHEGYALRIESNVPLALMVIFEKDGVELFRIKISNEIPEDDELIHPSSIKGWTEIKILK